MNPPRSNKKEMSKKEEITEDVEVTEEVTTTPKVTKKELPADNIIAEDPLILRPKELPLVIKPANGAWANEAQEIFARVLNGYAYKNPEKWATKKTLLLKQLADLKENPTKIATLQGVPPGQTNGITYKNRLIEN